MPKTVNDCLVLLLQIYTLLLGKTNLMFKITIAIIAFLCTADGTIPILVKILAPRKKVPPKYVLRYIKDYIPCLTLGYGGNRAHYVASFTPFFQF